MFKMKVLALSLLGLFSLCGAQFLQNGQCDPDISLAQNFDVEQFLGSWYETHRSENPIQDGDCSTFVIEGNDTLTYRFKTVNKNFAEEFSGTASLENGTAKFILNLNATTSLDFWILATDYVNFAIAYKCDNVGTTQRHVYAWLLGRSTSYVGLIPNLINNTLEGQLGFTISDLEAIDHSEQACYVLPVIEQGQAIILPGQCDSNINVVQNFDVVAFTGLWHEIASYHSESALGTCSRAEYTLLGGIVDVLNSQVVNQTLATISGNASVTSTDGSARLSVILEVAPNVFQQQDLFILGTDYTNFAISYACFNVDNSTKRVFSWILSRTRQLSAINQAAVDQVVDSYLELNQAYYQETNQTDDGCFYYPEPVPGQSVFFRGQCDMSIPAMPNFDAVRYMGLWHLIETYPSPFQNGECNNANYTLNNGVVEVFNTQVLNQTLDTIDLVGTVASDDGSAKLIVTFPVGTNQTVETDYWVLGTDYDTYSIVYSCTNIDADTRLVYSWKLSRTKQMPAAGTTAINNIINTIPVLDQRYFETVDQSVAACFYYPEPQPGVPVVFPGQCDETIAAVPNFNLQQFIGTWHEIEAYPKEFQPGQCVNHLYSSGTGNTLNLQSFAVLDQFLQVTNSTLSFSTTDNSGRMIITINSGGNVITIPFWILNTDYTSYALAYSCVNLNSDFRGIYSWKLSRTKQLTAAANTAINTTISNIQVLDNVYFETIDQTDDACFFLPELAPGEPVILVGQCDPNITVVQNFDAARYQGLWHLVESYPSAFQNGTCNDATYTIQSDGSVLVFNTQVINETLDTITGSATLATTDGSAKLLVTFPSAPGPIEYWVLDTDYESYSLVYSCVNLNSEQRQVWSWKLGRNRSLTANATNAINQIVNNIQVLNNRYYYEIDNTPAGCFYYPTPDGNPVRFRGQCDETIPVVTNFDAVAYMGLWYDIESYPQFFQEGTCADATYTLTDAGVNVFNTQVVNQTLDTITGLATVVSTDGSAKLNVNFPVAGTNFTIDSPYWVLSTDYQNYALVYTCINIDSEYRSVSSWKLSRQKSLSAAAATAINSVVNTVQVLRNDYYVNRNHTEAGCFYFPEPVAGQPVVFPGQCDNTIQAVPNFNLTSFAGTWHEIETYPKEDQRGQCINHNYTTGTGNTLNLQSSSVTDQFRDITTSTVAFGSANDTSGRLVITLNSNGTTITIPFWVLSTDYNDYALAYSCVNIDANYRGVYSWKLSRTKQLSTAANTTINTAISAINVLDNVYFEPVDQSDEACFYLPDLAPGEPVIIVGQCDPNITVVQNFDAARYQGLWHLVESYPSAFQDGTCNDATYTIQSDGSVLVFNTQVINETLDTITGSATLATTDGSAKLIVTFPSAPGPIEYWVLDTDYESYSLVYSCVNLNSEQRQVWSWKLGRSRSLTANAVTAINRVVDSINVLNNRYYEIIDNTPAGCFYYPTPDGNPVRFRGQCDETIPVVTNFDAVSYMGLWYDIESYPELFQDGTCADATYSLIDSGVNVFNTQVVNQRLDTITGLANVISTDGSAKLNVTFPIAGTNITTDSPYWVLATDYQNYALVYSCSNIDSEFRRVSSWKLSRQKSLSAAAATAINSVVNTVQVLRNDYYVNRNHTEAGCFYFPEPVAGQPVVFPGQCDNTIQAVPNFNLTLFAGTWHEIEAYPKEDQRGQCINHVYTTGTGNTLNLQSSSVIDQFRDISNSSVAFSSTNDTSGRLVITLNNNGTTVTIPFWVLSTDYNDYALAYSCVNIDANFRGVYSWKLSRTKQLSAASNTSINAVISAVQVLEQQYYEPVDQSDDACFYLPELRPNEPVVFVGQCDQNISVVRNFDANRFAGRWFDIESYFDEYQGDCIDSTFTRTNNGYDVILTQVVNETLDTTRSQAVLPNDGSARLIVTSNGVAYEYWILATDYETYALVYSCNNLNSETRRVRSWKMSRARELTNASQIAINAVVNTINVLDDRYYNERNHSAAACFYFPEPIQGQAVRFRGRCDESIPVVQNFDVARYLGLWYDIESYPQAFQDGTCATATYTLGANGVDVYNTQVVNQQLDTINGTAVVDSTDGSAKLLVTFPVTGTNFTISTPYWVLTTDYDSYSLVYSCANVDDEYKTVTVWKLSRQQNLTATANTAINSVINTIPVLRQEYFEETGHTDDDCFYYPDNNGGPVILDGQCPNVNEVDVVTNFNVQAFAGIWHEISRFPSELQSNECASSNYVVINNNTYTLTQSSVSNEVLITSIGPAVVSNDGRGLIATTLAGNGIAVNINLHILATDYTEYALAYSCTNLSNNTKQIYSWKFSRSRDGLSQAANNVINQIVSENVDLFEGYYENTDQSNDACFYYPEFDPLPESIELPGPCDERIRAKANFNATAYLGRWFDTARYPQASQRGVCNRAEYSSSNANGAIGVFNTQVLNGRLGTINGSASITSTDGSAELEVTFVINGVARVANLNVLETDYTSFALLYSCRNLDNGNRQVASWKMSRERTLSAQASVIIDEIINNTQGLLQAYYRPTSQSDEDCFYIPQLDQNSAVLFRGQCEDITGVQGFDIQRYLGWWHEIERYSSDADVGVCISSQIQASGNQFQVVDTNVFDLTATVNTSTLTATTDGRLRRTLSNGQVVDTWVLATDYDTYSLLYSCENVNDEYRRVWSAKHSKSRQLTQAAQNAMNATIQNNQVLVPELFIQVDQSDSACFYYPEPNGERVILPGQCDDSIPVVQNFDVGAYTGTWYQIERYPQIFESGTCTGARYTLNEDTGVVTVLNWEVVDGVLRYREGNATVSSDDGSARLTVVLPSSSGGLSTSSLYVLTTDYVSYSLAYSCFNVNQFQRAVGAWKISRTRTMPVAGTAAINAVIAQRQELHQPYFLQTEQSEDCDEPSSSYLVRNSIILMLICGILHLFF